MKQMKMHPIMIRVLVTIGIITSLSVHATQNHKLIPPMRPSMHLCTGYPTPPPTYTPTPTPEPTATPIAEHSTTILCADDSYVSAHSPNTNFGNSQVLTMRKDEYLIYMRFHLKQLEPNAEIVHTILRLTPFEIPPVSSTVKLYATSCDWEEDTITWNNRPSPQGQVGSLYVWTSTNPIEIDITNWIQEAYSQGINQVCMIAAYESTYFDLNVESQETARPPLLKIYYNTTIHPTATPTSEPTSGPGSLVTEITLNKTLFSAGDLFVLTARFGNQQPYPISASLWIVLNAGDAFWFWPEWGTTPSWQNATFFPSEEKVINPLQFVWPTINGSADGLKFWSVILDPTHTDIAIDSVNFGWM
ncbi:DNRLRE domain-containing protein [bacterium]|nr:DNRLRE domain-containing protein [candidate division CSSED10-310 bacterium]